MIVAWMYAITMKLFVLTVNALFSSYFGEILRTHGPLDSEDPKILEPLSFLPEDRKEKIEKAGGIAELLVKSGHFAMQGDLICPIEELGITAASIDSSLKSTGKSGGREENGKDPGSKAERRKRDGLLPTPSIPPTPVLLDGAVPNTHTKKSSLSGLLSTTSRAPGGGGAGSPGTSREEKEKGHTPKGAAAVAAGSKRNTSVLNVKTVSPADVVPKEKKLGTKTAAVKESAKKPRSRKERESVTTAKKEKGAEPKGEGVSMSSGGSVEKTLSRASSKDSSGWNSSSGNEWSSGKSLSELGKREVFSPTNSTSSMSSESSSGNAGTNVGGASSSVPPLQPLLPSLQAKKPTKANKPKAASQASSTTEHQDQSARDTRDKPMSVGREMQTDSLLLADKWVMTDTIPPVENYKERYDGVVKEKKDLQEKLERSEDQRFKLQKTHKREIEQLVRQTKQEVNEVGII